MTDTAYDDLDVRVDDPVAVITIDRPSRLNAFTPHTMDELRDAVARAADDARVVGIVITGAGNAFCAGLDAATMADTASTGANLPDPVPGAVPLIFSYLLTTPKPVIAALNGVCAGGGVVLALMSDLRVASEDAVITTIFSKRGLVAEHGTSWLLPRLVGTSRALDLLWSSRKVEMDEALRIGLVDRVVPVGTAVDAAVAYVRDLAANASPESMAATKRLVYSQWATSFEAAAQETHRAMVESLASDDFREGVASFVERRPPRFPRLGGTAES